MRYAIAMLVYQRENVETNYCIIYYHLTVQEYNWHRHVQFDLIEHHFYIICPKGPL